jgi:hypothetical protein
MQALRGAGEAQLFRDCDKITEAAEFHDIYMVSKVIAILYWRI